MGYNIKYIKTTLKKIYNIDIEQYSHAFLMNVAKKKSRANGCLFLDEYWKLVIKEEEYARDFHAALTIDYTDFFRDSLVFGYLEKEALPTLIHNKTNGILKIWSAGCSTGQEAYSIAIILNELLKDQENPVKFQIFATDKDETALSKARLGYFEESLIGNLKLKYLNSYFTKEGELYRVKDEIQSCIDFTSNDLMDSDTFYPKNSLSKSFDLILCNNVLFYYDLQSQIEVVQRFEGCLKKHAYLILGSVEYANFVEILNINPVSGIPGAFK